jgi:hypothetical protein
MYAFSRPWTNFVAKCLKGNTFFLAVAHTLLNYSWTVSTIFFDVFRKN